jgi:hypothetical protein
MQTQPNPKKAGIDGATPQKWLQDTSKHSWKGGIPKKSSKAPREYVPHSCGKSCEPNQNPKMQE